jgi:hypothetical protein
MITALKWLLGFVVPTQWAGLAAYGVAAAALAGAFGAVYWAGDTAGYARRDAEGRAAVAAALERHVETLVDLQDFSNQVAADFAAAETANEEKADALQKSIANLSDSGVCLTADVLHGIAELR